MKKTPAIKIFGGFLPKSSFSVNPPATTEQLTNWWRWLKIRAFSRDIRIKLREFKYISSQTPFLMFIPLVKSSLPYVILFFLYPL